MPQEKDKVVSTGLTGGYYLWELGVMVRNDNPLSIVRVHAKTGWLIAIYSTAGLRNHVLLRRVFGFCSSYVKSSRVSEEYFFDGFIIKLEISVRLSTFICNYLCEHSTAGIFPLSTSLFSEWYTFLVSTHTGIITATTIQQFHTNSNVTMWNM